MHFSKTLTCYDCKLEDQTNALSSTGDYCVQRIAQAQPGCFIVIIIGLCRNIIELSIHKYTYRPLPTSTVL